MLLFHGPYDHVLMSVRAAVAIAHDGEGEGVEGDRDRLSMPYRNLVHVFLTFFFLTFAEGHGELLQASFFSHPA